MEPQSSFTDTGSWAACGSATGVQIHLLFPFCCLSGGKEGHRMWHKCVCECGALCWQQRDSENIMCLGEKEYFVVQAGQT